MTTIAVPDVSTAPGLGVATSDRSSDVRPPSTPRAAKAGTFHIPSLDGIRAVAIILVFMAHAGVAGSPGGLGVTIFFFLSGFLITSLLRREYDRTNTIHFGKFYLRRILRIWPPMYVMMGLAIAIYSLPRFNIPIEWKPMLFQALHLTNFYQLFGSGKFLGGTSVMWSLAVEEHFYLVFPCVLFVLLRTVRSRQRIVAVLAALCVVGLAWRCVLIYGYHVHYLRTYKGTDTRFDSILFGCILALIRNPYMDPPVECKRMTEYVALVGSLLLFGLTLAVRDQSFRETFRYTLQGLACFPLFYLAVRRHSWPVFRWLEWPIMRALGALSYTMYLVHYLFVEVAEDLIRTRHAWVADVVAALVIVLFAVFMYYAVERPCGRLRKKLHV